MTDIETMIAEQARLTKERGDAYLAYEAAKKAYAEGSRLLTDALVAEGGWHVGQIVKLQSGGEAKIGYIRLTDDAILTAICYDKTLAGTWSKRPRMNVTLQRKRETA